MAYDKLVDSAQLDADLTTVADAIRTKGGTEGQLAFPAGFVSAVQAIEAGGGEAPPTTAVAQFHVAASIPGNLGSLTIDFSGLQQYMSSTKTYAWSLVMWRGSQVATTASYVANSFCINGRVSTGNTIDANDCRLTRTPSAALTAPYQLNVTDFKKSRTVAGTTVTVVSSVTGTEWAGDYVGIFTLLPPYTDAYTGDKLTDCPEGFLTFAVAEESTQSADISAEDALSIITGGAI